MANRRVLSMVFFLIAAAVIAQAGEKNAPPSQKVPVEITTNRDQADYEITGAAETQKASTAKKVILGNWHSREEASITVSNIKSGEVVWAYSVHQEASTHGKRSSAESCAKHLKDAIEEQ